MTDFRETPGTPEDVAARAELVEHWKNACLRFASGQCAVRSCLVRGGYTNGPPDYSKATCVEYETAEALASQRATIERLERERDEARAIVTGINNSVFGSEAYFTIPDCVEQIEKVKAYSGEHWRKAENAEAEVKRLTSGLIAISETEETTPASVLRALARAALSPTTASATTGEVGR